jgi:hypothetical protein
MSKIQKVDKMEVDKVLRFGDNCWYQAHSKSEYDRSSIRNISPLTNEDLVEMIDKRYRNGLNNNYLKVFNNLDDYILWRSSPGAYKDIRYYRSKYLREKIINLKNSIKD